MTLRARLGVSAIFVLAVLVIAGVLLPRTVRAAQMAALDSEFRSSLPFAVRLAEGLAPPLPPTATALSDLYIARVETGRQATVVAPAAAAGRQPQLPRARNQPGKVPSLVTVPSVEGSGSWRASLQVLPDGNQVLVAVPLDQVQATTDRLTIAVLIAGIVVMLAMGAAGWWLLRLGLQPIAEVTDVADAIAGGDRSRRVGEGVSGTEAAHLARAFNVMLDEQEAVEAKLRRFVADASHELRTPVSAISGFTDLWRQGAIDEGQLGDVMRRIGQESARMRGLVEDLLLLARLDEGPVLARESVDLSGLLADAQLDASATHPSRTVLVQAPVPVVVEGDEARLRQVVGNLVSNALIHTDPAARVMLRAEHQGDVALLSVADDGAGMTAEEATRAFDRFWRADPARARSGAGLGLAIVRSVVKAHGGTVHLRTAPGAGTTVQIVLPVRGGAPASNPQATSNQS
ncbi:MAG: two-component system, OmpR family, sensor kinase [Actinomycetota bacterium]|nr:two-component system, OmpR family, sensor kinase [Actinomycetota bacterium]